MARRWFLLADTGFRDNATLDKVVGANAAVIAAVNAARQAIAHDC
ncbi:hypothetical protein [Amycolatopsis sp. DSM 110486]|nr:hypothetical protein [Amycolatopsis sp. DSM 110486]